MKLKLPELSDTAVGVIAIAVALVLLFVTGCSGGSMAQPASATSNPPTSPTPPTQPPTQPTPPTPAPPTPAPPTPTPPPAPTPPTPDPPAPPSPPTPTPPPPSSPSTQLTFLTQPSSSLVSTPITPAIQIAIEDSSGNILTSATDPITLTPPVGAEISGQLVQSAIAGIATFPSLSLPLAGVYILTATLTTSTGSISITSNQFTISPVSIPPPAPIIEFCCDEIMQGFVTFALSANPSLSSSYLCDDCQPSTTTAIALSSFPAILATHPAIVVILTGTYDVLPPTPSTVGDYWTPACGNSDLTCQNLEQMIVEAQSIHAKLIILTIPPIGQGPLATSLDPNGVGGGNQVYWNNHLIDSYGAGPGGPGGGFITSNPTIPLIDADSLLAADGEGGQFIVGDTDNGIDPNSAGYQVLLPVIQKAIAGVESASSVQTKARKGTRVVRGNAGKMVTP